MSYPGYRAPPRAQYKPWEHGADCANCPLYHAGKVPVAPTGPWDAAIMFVGEGPAKWEEVKGSVLQGPSGQKLNEMLWKIGIRREAVFCTNAAQCRFETPGVEGKRRYDVKVYMAWHRKQNVLRKKQGLNEVPDPFTCCRKRLAHEMKTLDDASVSIGRPNGVVVQGLGNFALQQIKTILGDRIEGKLGSITKMRGSVLPVRPE